MADTIYTIMGMVYIYIGFGTYMLHDVVQEIICYLGHSLFCIFTSALHRPTTVIGIAS